MGLPTYNCSGDLPETFPAALTQHGIRVMPRTVPGFRHAYRFRRGLGTVDFGGFMEKEGDPYTFRLVCSSNPVFWFFDMRLLSRVERILLSHGASHWNPDETPVAKSLGPAIRIISSAVAVHAASRRQLSFLRQAAATHMQNRVRNDYARVWRRVCVGWLSWSENRFERFLCAFNAKLVADDGAAWFYHESPFYHIISLLVRDDFEERLHKEVRKPRYGTPEWVYFRRELLDAIEGRPLRQGAFDWSAARERAEEHLALYREKLPTTKTVTNFEKWILSFDEA